MSCTLLIQQDVELKGLRVLGERLGNRVKRPGATEYGARAYERARIERRERRRTKDKDEELGKTFESLPCKAAETTSTTTPSFMSILC